MFDLDEGKISYDGKPILGPKFNLIPGEDYIKYLAQDFDLMPYITVAENVGKFLSNSNKNKKDTRVNELLEMVEMTPFATVKAQYLSGGQMQRVAIARVLALEPEILLLDEPFSHIDNFRRSSLSRKLFAYLREKQITCIVATHDSSDVLSFADSVMIMKDGESVEMGSPKTIHHHPKNKYVASFFGDVNEIPSHFIIENSQSWEPLFIYPHELVVAVDSVLKVTTKKSYFRGSYYLIESVYENGTLFFQSEIDFPEDTIVFLKRKA
jgi:ABC-type Fe3+/spermidine/putrescine transport system ATPase subunit